MDSSFLVRFVRTYSIVLARIIQEQVFCSLFRHMKRTALAGGPDNQGKLLIQQRLLQRELPQRLLLRQQLQLRQQQRLQLRGQPFQRQPVPESCRR